MEATHGIIVNQEPCVYYREYSGEAVGGRDYTSSNFIFLKSGSTQSAFVNEEIQSQRPEQVKTEVIRNLARQVCSLYIGQVKISLDEPSVEIEIYGSASAVLHEWLKLIDAFKQIGINIPVYPIIRGENDLTPQRFGVLLGKGMAKMNVSFQTREPIDAVKLLEEEKGL